MAGAVDAVEVAWPGERDEKDVRGGEAETGVLWLGRGDLECHFDSLEFLSLVQVRGVDGLIEGWLKRRRVVISPPARQTAWTSRGPSAEKG